MNFVVLQDAEGAQIGFMLCNPELGEPSGHCVFMVLPEQAEQLDTPAAELFIERRVAGESTWEVTVREPISVVVRTPGLPAELFIELDGSGAGQWGVGSGSDRQFAGRALLPPST